MEELKTKRLILIFRLRAVVKNLEKFKSFSLSPKADRLTGKFPVITDLFNLKQINLSGVDLVKDFPLLPLENILKKAGKEAGADRVSESAVLELKNIMLETAEKIAIDSMAAARHAKRVTIKREDVQIAVR